jgi:hypothetical protein
MKTYEVELRYESYVTITVEADNEDEAEAMAWKEIEADWPKHTGSWSFESVEEIYE